MHTAEQHVLDCALNSSAFTWSEDKLYIGGIQVPREGWEFDTTYMIHESPYWAYNHRGSGLRLHATVGPNGIRFSSLYKWNIDLGQLHQIGSGKGY